MLRLNRRVGKKSQEILTTMSEANNSSKDEVPPSKPEGEEISQEDLEKVSGGWIFSTGNGYIGPKP